MESRIATFSAVSELIASGFSPQRTVLLASGFDEEGGGVVRMLYGFPRSQLLDGSH
jgi:acetylornithine deacetylase/succinyl-diaminopimelate desuccinylase-like protein